MKHLQVKWEPETVAKISLTAADTDAPLRTSGQVLRVGCGRLIVISGGVKLKADVKAVQRLGV